MAFSAPDPLAQSQILDIGDLQDEASGANALQAGSAALDSLAQGSAESQSSDQYSASATGAGQYTNGVFSQPDATSFMAGGAFVGAIASLPISYYSLSYISAAGEMSIDALALPLTIGAYSTAAGAGVGLIFFVLYEMITHPPASPYGPSGPAAPIPFP